MNNMTAVYIGLGSNMNNSNQQLDKAIKEIVNCDNFSMVLSSSYYQSSPVGFIEQDDFINCVVRADTSFTASELLTFLQNLENDAGRTRDVDNQNAPRPLDCDILLYGSQEIDEPDLQIPHPRMTLRLFVMEPLVELNKKQIILNHGPAFDILEELKKSPVGQAQKVTKLN